MRTEELIDALSGDLRPVRRMASPGRQALGWLGLAVGLVALCVAAEGLRHDLAQRMALPAELGQWVASIATGVAAAVAAAMLARPDRSAAWVLLPVPPLLAWLASLGLGCLADMQRMGPEAMQVGTSWGCFRFILLLGLPLTAAQLWLLRHAALVRPAPVVVLAGLASAGLCSAGLTLFHHLDAALMVLLWHGGASAMVVLASLLLGGPFLARAAPR